MYLRMTFVQKSSVTVTDVTSRIFISTVVFCYKMLLIKKNPLPQTRVLISSFHTSRGCMKTEDRKNMLASVPKKDEGAEGERSVSLDSLIQK